MEIESRTSQVNKAGFFARRWGSCKSKVVDIAKNTKKLAQDDPRRIFHSLKVGSALTLVSLIYYYRPLYDSFGISGIWAVLTVVVVFEFSVGATISKCLNRGFATFLAGGLGLGAQHLASLFGNKGEPIALGILVFLLATISTFTRFFPGIKKRYDYGVLIFILTFSMVTVSGYRVENLLEMAYQRLITIIIGVSSCMVVSIFIFPVWAGEDLHKLVALNIEKVSNSLEGFGSEYFGSSKDEGNLNESFLKAYRSVLTSKSNEDSLANFARWEPGHGRFRLRHPWKQYSKAAALTRQCAYLLEALNGYITSEIQVPLEFRSKIENPCRQITSESSKALKELSISLKNMTKPSASVKPHVENAQIAVKDLQFSLQIFTLENSDILAIIPDATVASILTETVKCVEQLSESVHELSGMARFRNLELLSPEKQPVLHRGTVKPVLDGDCNGHVIITVLHESCLLDSPEIEKGPAAGKRVEV